VAKRGKLSKITEKTSEERPVRLRKYQYLFLVVCEDEKTEPAYFEEFKKQIPSGTIFLKTVGTGRDAKGVVEKTIKEREVLSIKARREVDVTWAVFDTDDAGTNSSKARRFQDAFKIGKENNIHLAYSNEVFELWLLLHLAEVDSRNPLRRAQVYSLIQEFVRKHPGFADFEYKHGDTEILEILNVIGNQSKAIERATILLQEQQNREPINANPSTRVHLLVQDLISWIKYYSYEPG
jgi:hypothetical protein